MKRVGFIWENVYDWENLMLAFKMASKDKSYYDAVKKTKAHLFERIAEIQKMLQLQTYKPGRYSTSIKIDKGKKRILYKLPFYPDRIIQWAVMLQIRKHFERRLENFVCASLPDRGIHYASNLLQSYLETDPENCKYFLKIDVHKFYPSINREILKKKVRTLFKDKRLLWYLDLMIDSQDNSNIDHLRLSDEERAIYLNPGHGIPIGSYLSQYLANFCLSDFDHWLKEVKHCPHIIRYMDDVVILSSDKKFLHQLQKDIVTYLAEVDDLQLKSNWHIGQTAKEGIDIVGYRHFGSYKLLRKKSAKRYKKICLAIKKAGINLTEKQYHQALSMCGWMEPGNCFHLVEKYLTPIAPAVATKYEWEYKSSKRSIYYAPRLYLMYENTWPKRMTKLKSSHKPIHKKNRGKHD